LTQREAKWIWQTIGTEHMPAHQTTYQPTWTTERIELLKNGFQAGLSCREIAAQIGVSRNAVIGKISRLNLTRDKGGRVIRVARKQAATGQGPRGAARLRQIIAKALQSDAQAAADEEPIHNGHTCSLFELSNVTCRWPISTPGAVDFCFCGNPPLEGLPYCAGHSRLAYRISAHR
jgi:GcrA cell cycle regulator